MAWPAFHSAFDQVIAGLRRGHGELLKAFLQPNGPCRIVVPQLADYEAVDGAVLCLLASEQGGHPELNDFAGLKRERASLPGRELESVVLVGD